MKAGVATSHTSGSLYRPRALAATEVNASTFKHIFKPLVESPNGTLKLDQHPYRDQTLHLPSPDLLISYSEGGRSIAVQTAYRDGDAQTVPYEPELVPHSGKGALPEVSKLSFLRYGGPPGASLPAAIQDVRAVEAARERARIEASLPPMTDEASFELRKALMETVELAALRQREVDLDTRNGATVALIEQAVAARAAEREFVAEQRVEALRRTLEAERESALASITSRRIRTMRKLGRSHASEAAHVDMLCGTGSNAAAAAVAVATASASTLGRKRQARDIIAEYTDPASKMYAPMLRDGLPKDTPGASMRREVTAVPGAPLSLTGGRGGAVPELSTAAAVESLVSGGLPPSASTLLPLRTLKVAGGAAAAASALRVGVATNTASSFGTATGTATSPSSASASASLFSKATLLDRPGGRKADAHDAIGKDLDKVYAMIQTTKAGLSTTAVLNATLPAWRIPLPREDRPSTPVLASEGGGEGGRGGMVELVGFPGSHTLSWGEEGGEGSWPLSPSSTTSSSSDWGRGSVGGHTSSTVAGPSADPMSALVRLQALLRGRAVQRAVAEGVSRRQDLIREIQFIVKEEEEAEEAKRTGEAALARLQTHTRASLLEAAAGEITSAALDFFTKEAVRVSEMRRVSSLAMAAAAERRAREEVERARREEEAEAMLRLEAEEGALEDARGEEATDLVTAAILRAMTEHANEEASLATGIPIARVARVVAIRDASALSVCASVGLSEDAAEEVLSGEGLGGSLILGSPTDREVARALSLAALEAGPGEGGEGGGGDWGEGGGGGLFEEAAAVIQEVGSPTVEEGGRGGGGHDGLASSSTLLDGGPQGDLDLSMSTTASAALEGSASALPSALWASGGESGGSLEGGGTDVAAALEASEGGVVVVAEGERPATASGVASRGSASKTGLTLDILEGRGGEGVGEQQESSSSLPPTVTTEGERKEGEGGGEEGQQAALLPPPTDGGSLLYSPDLVSPIPSAFPVVEGEASPIPGDSPLTAVELLVPPTPAAESEAQVAAAAEAAAVSEEVAESAAGEVAVEGKEGEVSQDAIPASPPISEPPAPVPPSEGSEVTAAVDEAGAGGASDDAVPVAEEGKAEAPTAEGVESKEGEEAVVGDGVVGEDEGKGAEGSSEESAPPPAATEAVPGEGEQPVVEEGGEAQAEAPPIEGEVVGAEAEGGEGAPPSETTEALPSGGEAEGGGEAPPSEEGAAP